MLLVRHLTDIDPTFLGSMSNRCCSECVSGMLSYSHVHYILQNMHGVLMCFLVVSTYIVGITCNLFKQIIQGCWRMSSNGKMTWFVSGLFSDRQYLWRKSGGHGWHWPVKTITKHKKAWTVCKIIGTYCTYTTERRRGRFLITTFS